MGFIKVTTTKLQWKGQAETHIQSEHTLSKSQHTLFPRQACPEITLGSCHVKCRRRDCAHYITSLEDETNYILWKNSHMMLVVYLKHKNSLAKLLSTFPAPSLQRRRFTCSWSHAAVTAMGRWPSDRRRAISLTWNAHEIVQNQDIQTKFWLSPFSAKQQCQWSSIPFPHQLEFHYCGMSDQTAKMYIRALSTNLPLSFGCKEVEREELKGCKEMWSHQRGFELMSPLPRYFK